MSLELMQLSVKPFFLTTLGFDKKNDSLKTTILSDSSVDLLTPKLDRRGTNLGNKRLDHQKIRNHIESFNPGISHY